jgi:hypothetical protein
MIDNWLFNFPLWLTVVLASAIEVYFRLLLNSLALWSSRLKQHQQRVAEQEMRYIVELLEDRDFFTREAIRVYALAIIAVLLVGMVLMWSWQPHGLWGNLTGVFLVVVTLVLEYVTCRDLRSFNKARQYYREDHQIDQALGPDFDETAYLSQSPANAEALRQSLQELLVTANR